MVFGKYFKRKNLENIIKDLHIFIAIYKVEFCLDLSAFYRLNLSNKLFTLYNILNKTAILTSIIQRS